MTITVDAQDLRAKMRAKLEAGTLDQLVAAATYTATQDEAAVLTRRMAASVLRERMDNLARTSTDRQLIDYLATQSDTLPDDLLNNCQGIAFYHELERRHASVHAALVDWELDHENETAGLTWFAHVMILATAVDQD